MSTHNMTNNDGTSLSQEELPTWLNGRLMEIYVNNHDSFMFQQLAREATNHGKDTFVINMGNDNLPVNGAETIELQKDSVGISWLKAEVANNDHLFIINDATAFAKVCIESGLNIKEVLDDLEKFVKASASTVVFANYLETPISSEQSKNLPAPISLLDSETTYRVQISRESKSNL